jgi:hypothetical protein
MKTFIGKGKRNEKFNGIIDVTIDMNQAQAFLFEGEKGTYLRFSVSERKEKDQYGNTHAVSCWTPDAQPAAAVVAEPPAPTKRKKKAAVA